ncbi:MAG TPA: hypothetical protein VM487_05170 [Phycisphaerae bacterium]|nr:hypothetical protein [Phycisphaerae bacterium]
MTPRRPILLEAIAFGVFIFLVAGVLFGVFVPAYSSHSTPAERAAAKQASWLATFGSAAVGTLAASVYARYQRKRLLSKDDEPRCESCGYMLRGLPEPRCPECGEPFADDGKG